MDTSGRKAAIRMEIANKVKALRIEKGYTSPEQFCEMHNFSLQEYLDHENGKKRIKASQAILYAKAMRVSLFRLLLGAERRDLRQYLLKKAADRSTSTS